MNQNKAKRSLKICMIGNPGSIHFRRWTEMIQSRGHEIIALVPNPVENLSATQHSIEPSRPIPFIRTFQRILQTRKLVKKIQPDLVIGQYMAPFGWCAAFSGGTKRTVISWGSDISPLITRSVLVNAMTRFAIPRFNYVIALSEFLKKAFKDFGAKPDQIVRVNYPLSIFPEDSRCPSFVNIFAQFGLKPGRYLVSIRGMSPVYNQETILHAIPEIIKFAPDLKFVFICYSVDKSYLNKIKKIVDDLKIKQVIVFLDAQQKNYYAVLCRNALAAISIAKSDGMPMSVLEVMSLGVPLVAGKIPPIEEILKDDINGFVVDLFDSKQIANAIKKLLSDPNIIKRFANYNQTLIEEFIKPDKGFIKVEEILN